jgi:hypothetical protein
MACATEGREGLDNAVTAEDAPAFPKSARPQETQSPTIPGGDGLSEGNRLCL